MELRLRDALVRSWRTDDAAPLVEAANNQRIAATLRDIFPHPYTVAGAEAYLGRVVGHEPELSFCIEIDGRPSGGIGFHPGADVNRLTAEVGYWLAESFWGGGIMTDVVRAMVAYAFATQPFERIEGYVFANNPASERVLQKAGFTREGRLRRNVTKNGELLDTFVYSILRDEQG
jgi:RimJ/RimL family protein N-acetyltransferase